MAELSLETQAILDRLKREGQLTRNSGTNSIRAVKIQMEKFEGIFSTISNSIVDQTSLVRQSLNVQEAEAQVARRERDFEDLQRPPEPTPEPAVSPEEQKEEAKERRSLLQLMGSAFSRDGLISILKGARNVLLGSAAVFAIFNLAKGYIDAKFGGSFTKIQEMVEQFSVEAWKDAINGFPNTLKLIDEKMTEFGNLITRISDGLDRIDDFLAAITLGAGGGLFRPRIPVPGRGPTAPIPDGPDRPNRNTPNTGGGGRRGIFNLRRLIAGIGLGLITDAVLSAKDKLLGKGGDPKIMEAMTQEEKEQKRRAAVKEAQANREKLRKKQLALQEQKKTAFEVENEKAMRLKQRQQNLKNITEKVTAGVGDEALEKTQEKTMQKAGEIVAKNVGPIANKIVQETTESSLKTVLKKIPLVSILAGGIFAAQRAIAGDYTGAGLELASGIVGTVPGAGTAASLTLDAALIARDVENELAEERKRINAQDRRQGEIPTYLRADAPQVFRRIEEIENKLATAQGLGPIVVSNQPVIAPNVTNITKGGSTNIQQNNVSGGGAGQFFLKNPYGIPSGAN